MKKLNPVRITLMALMLLQAAIVNAETNFVFAPEFNVGDAFPDQTLKDQDGNAVTISTSSGSKGYLIAFNRSVVW